MKLIVKKIRYLLIVQSWPLYYFDSIQFNLYEMISVIILSLFFWLLAIIACTVWMYRKEVHLDGNGDTNNLWEFENEGVY